MTALPTIYITLYNRRQTESNQTCLNCRGAKEEDAVNHLTHNDLGGTCCGIASSAIYNIIHRAFRRCQTRDRRKALCVSGLQMLIGWHTAKTAVYWQIAAVRWIIQPYSGKIWLRHEI